MRLSLWATIAWLALAGTALARDIFVDNVRGNDVNEGTSQGGGGRYAGPVRSINKALRIASPGDRIVLAKNDEPYRESIGLSAAIHCGWLAKPLVIDGQSAVLDGTTPIPTDVWQPASESVFRCRPKRLSFQQLFVDGVPLPERTLDASAPLSDLEPGEWTGRDGYLYYAATREKLPGDAGLSCSLHQTGITLYHVHDVVIMNLVVRGFQYDGIQAADGAQRCQIVNVELRGNGRAGVTVGGDSRVRLKGVVAEGNGHAQAMTTGLSVTFLDECELSTQSAPAVLRQGGRVFVNGVESLTEGQEAHADAPPADAKAVLDGRHSRQESQ